MSLTIKQAVDIGTKTLQTGGCATPSLDARVLMLYLLKEDQNYYVIHSGERMGDKALDEYFTLVDQRAAGKPVQYITGRQEFWKLKFMVNENVLIPRPDTETVIETAIELIIEASKNGNVKILDIGCGSGTLGVSLAHQFGKSSVTAIDISEEALTVAKKNAESNNVANRMKFLLGDMFEPLIPTGLSKIGRGPKFDVIVSNPPYIKTDVIPTLQREIIDHEPVLALDGGSDGLTYYRIIAETAHNYMKKNGCIILEIGYDQAEEVCDILIRTWKYRDIQVTKDLAGLDRVVSARLANI